MVFSNTGATQIFISATVGSHIVSAVNASSSVINPANLGSSSGSASTFLNGTGTFSTPPGGLQMVTAGSNTALSGTSNQFVYVTATGVQITLPTSPIAGQTIYMFTNYSTGTINAGSIGIRQGNATYPNVSNFSDISLTNLRGIIIVYNGSFWFTFGN